MDYRDFTKRDVAYSGFIKARKEVLDSVDNGNFADVFTELCTKALEGNCIAQDTVAYFFNKGIPDKLIPHYESYMKWQILAAANGNEFAMEKLEFFLNSALDRIVNTPEVIKEALRRRNITKDNALYVISNLLCEGIVDELKINPKDLIDFKTTKSLYSPEKNRPFLDAIEKCIYDVAQYLMT